MFLTEHQKIEIVVVDRCYLSTVKGIRRRELENCNEDYETVVAGRKKKCCRGQLTTGRNVETGLTKAKILMIKVERSVEIQTM
nr:hypothetical protein HmN_000259200 [Hymenolepis microstoma]